MAPTLDGNDRKLGDMYSGLLPIERARLMARVYRAEDLPQIALLRSSTPSRYRNQYCDAGRILCRLRFPLLPMAESLLHRAERDLARLVEPAHHVALKHLCHLSHVPLDPPARTGIPGGDAGGPDALYEGWQLGFLVRLTAASYARARVELAAIAEVVGELRRDVFGGENPLPREVEDLLEQAAATLAEIPAAWARVEKLSESAGIRRMPALEEPDAAMIAEQVALVRELLTHDGWM